MNRNITGRMTARQPVHAHPSERPPHRQVDASLRRRRRSKGRSLARGLALLAVGTVVFPALVVAISILHFLWIIDAGERPPARQAEAIVALSGDPARITQAVELLAAGRGGRLLVTGVDNEDEVARQRALRPGLFACCIDVDHRAQTTHEDAATIAEWATARHVESLLVVTSSPHLPRALVEINDALPGVRTDPSAVVKGLTDFTAWRTDPILWDRLAVEYLKSLGAVFRNRFPLLWPSWWTGDLLKEGRPVHRLAARHGSDRTAP